MQLLPCHIAGLGGRQIGHRMSDVCRLAQMPERDLHLQRFFLFFGQLRRHLGGDEARGHAVDRDAAAAQFAGQGAGHAGDAGLGRCIVGLPRVAHGADHAGDADDAPETLLHHRTDGGAADAENGLQVGVEHRIPIFILHAHGQGVARDAGVVHQHLQAALMPGDGVDQRFDGGAVVHIQPRTPAAVIGRQYLADVLGALVRGGRADHLVAAPRQFQRNRRTNAARCARDQRHWRCCLRYWRRHCRLRHANNSRVLANVARSNNAAPTNSGAMRRVRPVSTWPGPHSTIWVAPRAWSACTHSTQRTGLNAWRYSAWPIAAASCRTATSTLLTTAMAGLARVMPASAASSLCAAARTRLQWKGADTGSGNARLAPAALSSAQALATPAWVPAITVWTGSLKLTASTTSVEPAPNAAEVVEAVN